MKKITFFFVFSLSVLQISCGQQPSIKDTKMKTFKIENPLLCDPELGICTLPDTSAAVSKAKNTTQEKPIQVIYFTDPICSSCWGIEPQLRKMKLEYGDSINIEYRMGGLLKDWSYNAGGISKPSDVAHHWDKVSGYYEMPIDGEVWLEDPLDSSYPPSIAFKAAQMQDTDRALLFLRRIREMVFLEKKNITRWEHLEKAAEEVGLNTVQLKKDYEGKAKALFTDDLLWSKQLGVRGFPTLFFINKDDKQMKLYGSKPYSVFEHNIRTLLPGIPKKTYATTAKALFEFHPTLTTKEYATLSMKSTEVAKAELESLFEQKLLQQVCTKNGILWIGKTVRY